MTKTLYIFGASGLSREVSDIALEVGYTDIKFIDMLDSIDQITGFEIVSEASIVGLEDEQSDFVIGVGESKLREKIYNKFPKLNFVNLVHPSATFGGKQRKALNLQRGNIICAGARFTNNIKLGDFGLYNLNITVGHDCTIENFVTISPGANVSGNVLLKECTYIGTGATILQGTSLDKKMVIGTGSTVGAGAVVVKDVPENVVVKGIPAK